MPDYVRPNLPQEVFYDSAGAVIDYGNRYRGKSPPDDSYSVDSNPQRFAPLHLVADALIEHLTASYAVEIIDDIATAADLIQERQDVLRAVRIIPPKSEQATLTVVYTSYPGVIVHAGLLQDFPFPLCGCDACDESLERVADELEQTVLSVVAGGFTEWIDRDRWLSIGHGLLKLDGTNRGAGMSAAEHIPTDRLQIAEDRLKELSDVWQPWTPLS